MDEKKNHWVGHNIQYGSVKVIESTSIENNINLQYNSFETNPDIVSNMGTVTLYKNIVRLNATRALYSKSYHLYLSQRVTLFF